MSSAICLHPTGRRGCCQGLFGDGATALCRRLLSGHIHQLLHREANNATAGPRTHAHVNLVHAKCIEGSSTGAGNTEGASSPSSWSGRHQHTRSVQIKRVSGAALPWRAARNVFSSGRCVFLGAGWLSAEINTHTSKCLIQQGVSHSSA